MEDTSAAIYSEAKSEYTKQLVFNFQPALLRFFLDRYTEAKAAPAVVSKSKSALSEFQDSLSQIPEWNLDKVQRETATLIQTIHCDYTDDLITAVFIAHTKILSAIRLHAKPRRKINITVPKPEHFMHRAMSECSRLLWSSVYLFSDSVPSLERQKNMNAVNVVLEEGILQAIRNLLPVKSILRDSLQEDEDDAIHIAQLDPSIASPIATDTPTATAEPEPEPVPTSVAIPVPEMEVATPQPVIDLTPIQSLDSDTAPVEPLTPATPALAAAPTLATTPTLAAAPAIPATPANNTLIVETEKSVGFTGMDSVYGFSGDAEIRPMIEEDSDEFKIIGESESLGMDDIEDLDGPAFAPEPLGAGDYETL